MLASYKSKYLILHRITDLSCVWTSIIHQEILGNNNFHLTMNTQAVTEHPTFWDADLCWAQTSMIHLEKVRLS